MPLKRSPGDGNLHGTIITDNEPVINGGGGGSQIPPWDNTVPPPPPAEPERKRAAVQVTAAKNTSPEKEKALPAKKKTSPTKKTRTKKTLVVETEKKERQRRVGRVAPRPVPIIVPTRPQERIVEVGLLDEQQTPSPPLRPQPQAPSSPILQPQAPFPPQMPIVVPTWEQEMAVAGYLLDEPPPLQRLQAPPPYVPVGVPTWQQEIMSIMGYSFNEQPILPPSPPPPQQLPPPPQQQQSPSPTFTTKNEKKWNDSLQKLVKYKNEHEGSTLVPQCYHEDYQLGRWVHYQRVEYWIYQSTGKGKITPQRIAQLEQVGMVWDPQRAIWQAMFAKLQDFVALHGHAKVPKGFTEDLELANWVRNQRLEYANQLKGKNTRMTTERVDLLNSVGFKWSTAAPTKFKIRRGTKKNPFKQRKNPSKQQQQLPLASPAQPYHQQPMAMTNEDIVDTDMSMEVAMGLACV